MDIHHNWTDNNLKHWIKTVDQLNYKDSEVKQSHEHATTAVWYRHFWPNGRITRAGNNLRYSRRSTVLHAHWAVRYDQQAVFNTDGSLSRYEGHIYDPRFGREEPLYQEIEKVIPVLRISVMLAKLSLVVAKSAFSHSVNYRSVVIFPRRKKFEDLANAEPHLNGSPTKSSRTAGITLLNR